MAIDVLDIFWKHLVHITSDGKLDSLIDEPTEPQGTANPPSGPEREMLKAFKRCSILQDTIANFTPILDRTPLTTNPQLSVAFLAKTKYPYGRRICEDKLHMLRQHTQSTGPLTARFLVDVVAIALHRHISRTAVYASEFSSYDGWPTRPQINLGVRYGFADRGWGRSYLGYRYIAVPSQVMLQVRFYEGKPFDGLNWRSPASVGVLHEVVILQRDRESVGPIAFRGVAPGVHVHVAGAEGIES